MCRCAMLLYERSKKIVVGDGTYGFVNGAPVRADEPGGTKVVERDHDRRCGGAC